VNRRRRLAEKNEKEEFPGNTKNMLPGNSFPQIFVVSESSVQRKKLEAVFNAAHA
jgi:hypothetical protein